MNNDIKQILIKYINGSSSVTESAWAKKWIGESSQNEAAYAKLYEEWHQALASHHRLIDNEKAYKRFLKENTASKSIIQIKNLYKYAAIAIITLGAGWLLSINNTQTTKVSYWNEIRVAKGETKKILLPDSTSVIINAGSKLRYNKDFGKYQRNIELDGEALFDIAESKKDLPFIVTAKGFTIRDIGTIFNVKAYSEDNDFEASVLEGEISVEGQLSGEGKDFSKIFVTSNQILKIRSPKKTKNHNVTSQKQNSSFSSRSLQVIDLPQEDIEIHSNWIETPALQFEDTSFDDVIRSLNRKFNIKITLKDTSLSDYRYTGTFKDPENVFKILDIIQETTPIEYKYSTNEILIKRR